MSSGNDTRNFGPAKFEEFRIVIWAKHISLTEVHCQLTDCVGDGVTRVQNVKKFEICRTVIHDENWTSGVHTARTILNVEELVAKH